MSPRIEAEADLARVLAMVPWLAAHRNATKADVAARFGISRKQLERDLGLIMMVGVPPYSPGDYISIEYDGDTIDVWLAPYFNRPLRLTAAEGLAILAAGRALLAVPGSDERGPLATALDKLESAPGSPRVVVEFGAPEHLRAVRDAGRGERIEIGTGARGAYGHDGASIRARRSSRSGEWYTGAFDHLRDEPRCSESTGSAVHTTDETFPPVPAGTPAAVYNPRPDDRRVTVELPASAAWVAESFPAESVEDLPGGGQRVVLAVSETAWLERVLLRAGPGARVVGPPESTGIAADAAQRIRARYDGR